MYEINQMQNIYCFIFTLSLKHPTFAHQSKTDRNEQNIHEKAKRKHPTPKQQKNEKRTRIPHK